MILLHFLVYVAAGDYLIADKDNHRVTRCASTSVTSQCETVAGTGEAGSGSAELDGPTSVELHGSDDLVIADQNNNRVQVCSLASPGSPCTTVSDGNLNSPQGATMVDGDYLIVDRSNHRVRLCSSGVCSTVAGTSAINGRWLNYPWSVAVDADGNYVIADAWNHRVVRCSPDSDCEEMVTGLSEPHHVLVHTSGDYLVTNTNSHNILLCPSSSGSTSSDCTTVAGGSGGSGSAQLYSPAAAAIDANGDYAICDTGNDRIQLCPAAAPGADCVTVAGTGFSCPMGIAVVNDMTSTSTSTNTTSSTLTSTTTTSSTSTTTNTSTASTSSTTTTSSTLTSTSTTSSTVTSTTNTSSVSTTTNTSTTSTSSTTTTSSTLTSTSTTSSTVTSTTTTTSSTSTTTNTSTASTSSTTTTSSTLTSTTRTSSTVTSTTNTSSVSTTTNTSTTSTSSTRTTSSTSTSTTTGSTWISKTTTSSTVTSMTTERSTSTTNTSPASTSTTATSSTSTSTTTTSSTVTSTTRVSSTLASTTNTNLTTPASTSRTSNTSKSTATRSTAMTMPIASMMTSVVKNTTMHGTPRTQQSTTTTPAIAEIDAIRSVLFVGNVSLEEFADAVLLSSNVTLDDHLLVELFVLAGELASTVDVTQADILVEVAESLAYLSTLALESGGVRGVETPGGTAIESTTLTADSSDSSFSLGPFLVPSLPFTSGSVVTIVWPANPYGGNVSDHMVTFTYWQGGRPVAMNNITPPLTFNILQSEAMMVESGQIWFRRCVFWNTTTRSWRSEGVETMRENLTHVSCASSHATTFTVEWQKRACSLCSTDIPATFLQVEFHVPVASWIALACISLLYFSCILPRTLDRKDWKAAETNSESYFRPHHRIRVQSSFVPRLFRKKNPVRTSRPVTSMRMNDFEATAPSAVLQVLSPSGTKRLYVACPLLFRPGATLVLNEGGATEETHVVSNFQPQSLVISSVLLHTHAPGEVVVQKGSGTDCEVLQDVSEGEESVIDVVPAAGESGDSVVDSSGSSFKVACRALTDVTCPGSTIYCDAVLDADFDELSMLADSDVSDPVQGTFLFVGCCHPWVINRERGEDTLNFCKLDQLDSEFVDEEMALVPTTMIAMETSDSSGPVATHPLEPHQEHHVSHLRHARSEQMKENVDDAGCEDQGRSSESGDAEDTCVKVTSDASPCATQGMASTATTHGPTLSQRWKSASEEVWVTLASLLRHLRPHWLCYSVHLNRTERYCLLVTAVMSSGFWQCLMFAIGPGCLHEPSPPVCQSSGSFTDWDRLTHSLGGTLLSCTTTFGIFKLFNRPFMNGPRTPLEKKSILRRWATCGRVGWTLVVAVHLLCVLMVLRTTQFFASVILWRWVRGCALSAVTMTMSSPVVRALSFIRSVLNHYAVHGRRTL